jgi:hypothetical protein
MTDWLDGESQPPDTAIELGEVRGLNAIAAHQLADGDFQAASEVAGEVLNEIAGLGREPGPPDSPAGFYWQFEQLRALACILSAELALDHRDAVAAASRQFEAACRQLDLRTLAAVAGRGPP